MFNKNYAFEVNCYNWLFLLTKLKNKESRKYKDRPTICIPLCAALFLHVTSPSGEPVSDTPLFEMACAAYRQFFTAPSKVHVQECPDLATRLNFDLCDFVTTTRVANRNKAASQARN